MGISEKVKNKKEEKMKCMGIGKQAKVHSYNFILELHLKAVKVLQGYLFYSEEYLLFKLTDARQGARVFQAGKKLTLADSLNSQEAE